MNPTDIEHGDLLRGCAELRRTVERALYGTGRCPWTWEQTWSEIPQRPPAVDRDLPVKRALEDQVRRLTTIVHGEWRSDDQIKPLLEASAQILAICLSHRQAALAQIPCPSTGGRPRDQLDEEEMGALIQQLAALAAATEVREGEWHPLAGLAMALAWARPWFCLASPALRVPTLKLLKAAEVGSYLVSFRCLAESVDHLIMIGLGWVPPISRRGVPQARGSLVQEVLQRTPDRSTRSSALALIWDAGLRQVADRPDPVREGDVEHYDADEHVLEDLSIVSRSLEHLDSDECCETGRQVIAWLNVIAAPVDVRALRAGVARPGSIEWMVRTWPPSLRDRLQCADGDGASTVQSDFVITPDGDVVVERGDIGLRERLPVPESGHLRAYLCCLRAVARTNLPQPNPFDVVHPDRAMKQAEQELLTMLRRCGSKLTAVRPLRLVTINAKKYVQLRPEWRLALVGDEVAVALSR